MRYIILFCAASYLAGAGETSAESADCNAIKTTLIPYQIKLIKEHSVWRELHTIQIVRDPSGSDAISGRMNSTTSYVRKGTAINGMWTVDDMQYVRQESVSRLVHGTREFEGVDPKQLDWRVDLNFAVIMKWGEINGETHKTITDNSYKYLKTEPVTIGECTFSAHLGETSTTNRKTGKTDKVFSWYFPDLRLAVGNPTRDVTFQSISTAFESIDFAEANWPPAFKKADND